MDGRLVTDPDSFFREESEDVSTRAPVTVVSLTAVLSLNGPLVLTYALARAAPRGAGSVFVLSGIVGVLVALLVVFALWFFYSVLLHGLATLSGGDATLRETALLAGWGFVPALVTETNNAILRVFLLDDVLDRMDPSSVSIVELSATISSHPAIRVATLVTAVGLLWSCLIWTFAVKHAHGLTVRRSLAVAAVPTLVGIAFNVAALV